MSELSHSPLGKESTYVSEYQRDLLFPIARKLKRDEIGVPAVLPFKGVDIWNAYEMSWLNTKGKPIVAIAKFIFACESPNIIESKSFKLYLNSFNNTKFASFNEVVVLLQRDLSEACGMNVQVDVIPVDEFNDMQMTAFTGMCIDHLDVVCNDYLVKPELLQVGNEDVSEKLYSDILKSNCLVTGQPDWASVLIEYTGNKIQHEGLLQYLVSMRNHNEFHEQCVERIFMDIMRQCKPEKLTVYARYTRRGGLDINPYRTTEADFALDNGRLCRQ